MPTTFNAIFSQKDGTFNADFGSVIAMSGDKFFEFEQLSPSATWVIDHPLDKYPSVSIVDSAGSVVIGDVEYVSKKRIIVTFQGAFAGKAYLN